MIGGGNLRECPRLGRVSLVATGADDCGIRLWRLQGSGIVGVFCLRAVADLAVKPCMPAQLFLVDNFRVAAFADFVSGMGDGAGREFSDGVAAIVPVLAKGVRDDGGAKDDKRDQRNGHHCGEANQMFCVLEQNLTFSARTAGAASCA